MLPPFAPGEDAGCAAPHSPITFIIETGAVLSYLPEQALPFAQSALRQYTSMHLANGAYIYICKLKRYRLTNPLITMSHIFPSSS